MVRYTANEILNLIRRNEGINYNDIIDPDIELKKIIDIVLSECRCSIVDKNGSYMRFGSSTDIRIIKMLIQILLSDLNVIPAEVVSIALTKEGVIGPFKKIDFFKKYDKEKGCYDIGMHEIFPNEFHVSIFKNNEEIREKFLNNIIKPYVKKVIYENEDLMKKSPIMSYINKNIIGVLKRPKTDDELVQELIEILKIELNQTNDELVQNIANYIYINIMNNKYFKNELITRELGATELQKLGRISVGFHSMVESMSYETLQMIELRNFPYGELISIKDTFHTLISVLESLSMDFEEMDENEILKNIEKINILFNVTNKNKNNNEIKYRTTKIAENKYGDSDEFVNPENIKDSLDNLCKMIKVLLNKKDEIDDKTYINEVLRIHYRFIKIHAFESGNGRTARAIVNILLQSKELIGIFRKEKRKDYLEYIENANKIVNKNKNKYLTALSGKTLECIEIENEFLVSKNLPFLLIKG